MQINGVIWLILFPNDLRSSVHFSSNAHQASENEIKTIPEMFPCCILRDFPEKYTVGTSCKAP